MFDRKTSQPSHANVQLTAVDLLQAVQTLQRAGLLDVASPPVSTQPTPSVRTHRPEAWQRVERARVVLHDKSICSMPLPLQAEAGHCSLPNGTPAKRFVAKGIRGNKDDRLIALLVAPDWITEQPRALWAEGSSKNNFVVEG